MKERRQPELNLVKEDPVWESLTPREMEVLEHLSEGYTNQEIADRIGIGYATVCTFVKTTMAKLDAHTRTRAAFLFLTGQVRGGKLVLDADYAEVEECEEELLAA